MGIPELRLPEMETCEPSRWTMSAACMQRTSDCTQLLAARCSVQWIRQQHIAELIVNGIIILTSKESGIDSVIVKLCASVSAVSCS